MRTFRSSTRRTLRTFTKEFSGFFASSMLGRPSRNSLIDTVNGVIMNVTDINVIRSDYTVVGWMYQTQTGARYFQPDFATHAGWNWSLNLGIVSGGSSSPGGVGPVKPWTGSLPPGSRPYKCFTDGHQLIS